MFSLKHSSGQVKFEGLPKDKLAEIFVPLVAVFFADGEAQYNCCDVSALSTLCSREKKRLQLSHYFFL